MATFVTSPTASTNYAPSRGLNSNTRPKSALTTPPATAGTDLLVISPMASLICRRISNILRALFLYTIITVYILIKIYELQICACGNDAENWLNGNLSIWSFLKHLKSIMKTFHNKIRRNTICFFLGLMIFIFHCAREASSLTFGLKLVIRVSLCNLTWPPLFRGVAKIGWLR